MTAPAGTDSRGSSYLPGLDGLRALAVVGVLGYHSDWAWLHGGFLGVSLFFTLSGFLITRLMLVERAATGSIDLRRFWSRRARRLLPAAFAGIALATAVTAAVGTASQRIELPGDAGASLFYVANWRFVLAGTSYAGLYEAPSTLQHMWSLAVEEQLYLVVPLLLAALLTRGRRAARLGVVALVAILAVGAALVASEAARETLYYGSHVRGVELLVGVALALWTAAPDRPAPAIRHLAGPLALAGVVWTWAAWRFADLSLYQGRLLLHAVLVAVVVWSVTTGPSMLTTVLEQRPLTWIGRRSYGIYLYHWPLFLLARQAEVDVSSELLHAAAWVGAFAVAGLSYTLLEQPIRTGRAVRGAARVVPGLVAAPVVCMVLALAVAAGQQPVADPEDAAARLDELESRATQPTTSTTPLTTAPPTASTDGTTPTTTVPGAPLRLAIFGDSIAAANGLGLAEWAVEHPRFDLVPGVATPGCPLVVEGVRWNGESPMSFADGCDWERSWPSTVAEHRPDVAVIATGAMDALPWSLPGEPARLHVGDPPVDERIRQEVEGINQMMRDAGVQVVWLTLPDPVIDNDTAPSLGRINWLTVDAAAEQDDIHVFDMARVVNRWTADKRVRRSDGVHLDPEDSRLLAREELGPWLLEHLDQLSV